MQDQPGGGSETSNYRDRRELIKKVAVGGAVAWVVPSVIQFDQAFAVGSACHNSILTDWDLVGGGQIVTFNGGATITNTIWKGNNIDVVASTFAGTPPWSAGQHWVDLVGNNTAGNITTVFNLQCAQSRPVTVSFRFSKYVDAVPSTMTVKIGSSTFTPTVPTRTNSQVFSQTVTLPSGPSTISIAGTGTGNRGPAIGDITISW